MKIFFRIILGQSFTFQYDFKNKILVIFDPAYSSSFGWLCYTALCSKSEVTLTGGFTFVGLKCPALFYKMRHMTQLPFWSKHFLSKHWSFLIILPAVDLFDYIVIFSSRFL